MTETQVDKLVFDIVEYRVDEVLDDDDARWLVFSDLSCMDGFEVRVSDDYLRVHDEFNHSREDMVDSLVSEWESNRTESLAVSSEWVEEIAEDRSVEYARGLFKHAARRYAERNDVSYSDALVPRGVVYR